MTDQSNTVLLVADDEPSLLMMVSNHFRAKGFKVIEAVDGDEAWELAHEHLPDAVILDVMMPGMTGWEVCRRIRETVSLAHTGVVMLTGMGENLNRMTSPLYGADAYVDKPFEFGELERKVMETLERRAEGAMGRADQADVTIVRRTPSALERELEALDDEAPQSGVVRDLKGRRPLRDHAVSSDDFPPPTRRSPWPNPFADGSDSDDGVAEEGEEDPEAGSVSSALERAMSKQTKGRRANGAELPGRGTSGGAYPLKAPAKKAPAKKAPAKKAPAKKAPAKKAPAKKAPAKKAPAKRAGVGRRENSSRRR